MKAKALIAALALLLFSGFTARAVDGWSVSNPTGSTFRITRSTSGTTETVKYRTVNLSAYAGQHYTAKSGEVTFGPNDTYKDVTVSETTPGTDAYKYQDGTKRKYRFDVTDMGGFHLAHCDREITTGTSVPGSGAFDIKDVDIYSGVYTADDDGYDENGYKSVASSSFFDDAAPKTYYQYVGAELRMTLSFKAKENDDAYEYLQILFDNTSSCDNRSGASNGNPGTPNLSRYMAGFEINSGSQDDSYKSYTFPVTTVGSDASATNPWGHGTAYPLTNQKFKSGYRATDGRLIVPLSFSSIVLRLNASGTSGTDEWAVKEVKAHIQAVESNAPTVSAISVAPGYHAKGNIVYVSVAFNEIVKVTGTPTLTTTSSNKWGSLTYVAGDGTNVLTFSREIPANASGSLNITGLSGTVKDLAGNSLTGSSVTASGLCSLDASYAYTITYDLDEGSVATANPTTYTFETASITLNNPTKIGHVFNGWTGSNGNTPQTTVTIAQYSHGNKSYTANWTQLWTGSGSQGDPYTINSTQGLDLLAQYVNSGNNCSSLYFQLGGNIIYSHTSDWDNSSSTENNYTSIGTEDNPFQGTFDGNNNTVSGIRIYKDGNGWIDRYQGLFGAVKSGGTVKRVNLADARITGFSNVGGIAGEVLTGATIEDCTVAADVCIHAVLSSASYHGGIVGWNQSPIRLCISRAHLTVADGKTGCQYYGGIAGYNSNNITDCIADGVVIPDVNARGAIVGNMNTGTLTRNYYRGCTVAGVANATGVGMGNSESTSETSDITGAEPLYAVTLPEHASLTRSASATLPGSGNKTCTNGADIAGAPFAVASTNLLLTYDSSSIPSGYVLASLSAKQTSSGTAVAVTAGDNYTYNLTMPAADVTVTATLLPIVSYIDADGNEQSVVNPTQIVASTTRYGNSANTEAWYYVSGDVIISGTEGVRFLDQQVNIILCDGATLTSNATNGGYGGIEVGNGSLAIYAQAGGTGSIVATSNGFDAIFVIDNLNLNGGYVSCTTQYGTDGISSYDGDITIRRGYVTSMGSTYGIFSSNNLTILGGTVNATAPNSGLYSYAGDVSILGGNVTASGETGIVAGKNKDRAITLGCATAADRITASSYAGNVVIADGQTLTDGTATYTATLTSEEKAAIAGKTLQSAAGAVSYIDADGVQRVCVGATQITSSGDYGSYSNAEGWYYVSGDVSLDSQLILADQNVHLILCDGANLTINTTNSNLSALLLRANASIYGQSVGSGSIIITSNNHGIDYSSGGGILCINGGNITTVASSGYNGINREGDIIIRRGTVNSTGSIKGRSISILGGNVTATGTGTTQAGIYSLSGFITLGWSKSGDSITASSYVFHSNTDGAFLIATGQALSDGTNTYTGLLNTEQIAAIAGKTLRPAENPSDDNLDLTARKSKSGGISKYFTTFYHPTKNYKLLDGAQAFTLNGSKQFYLVGDGSIVPANCAVVIFADKPAVSLTATNETATPVGTNILQGVSVATAASTLVTGSQKVYVISGNYNGIGLYEFTGTTIPAYKAYIVE